MTTPAKQLATQQLAAEQLAARLLYVQRQKKTLEAEEGKIKEALEELYSSDAIPTKSDMEMLFSDGDFHKVRLQRQKTGTYFKVAEDYKDDYSKESHNLQAKYLNAGKAEMAEKACTWKVQEVK
jgi:hypothetical protein